MKYERLEESVTSRTQKRDHITTRPLLRSCGELLEEWSHTRPIVEPRLLEGSSLSRESQPHMTRPRESSSLTHSRSPDCSTDTSMSSSATSLPPSVGSTAALSRS